MTTKSTLQSRVEKAAKILTTEDFSEKDISKNITQALEKIGIDDSEIGVKVLEAETTEFELFQIEFSKIELKKGTLVVNPKNVIPIARLKVAWEFLKGENPFEKSKHLKLNTDSSLVETLMPIGQWSDIKLLEKYEKGGSTDVEDQLKRRAKGRFCIVFNEDDGTVNAEDSLYMIRKARHQEMPDTFMLRGHVVQLYKVGEFPQNVFHECPVHRHKLLVDGYCDECGKTWDVNEYNKNVFIRLLVENEDVDVRLYRKLTFDELKNEFPKVFIIYKDLEEEGKLPPMKSKSSKTVDGADPFRHKTY